MLNFEIGKLKDVVLVKPAVFPDHRGFFQEMYHYEKYVSAGIKEAFVQGNIFFEETRATRDAYAEAIPTRKTRQCHARRDLGCNC